MEDISADDDLLSDILLDGLEFDPPISTHKMNQTYRSPRYETNFIMALLKQRIVLESDVNAALEELSRLRLIQRHLQDKDERQAQAFYAHARRYLETYLPDAGVEFALTARYKRPHPSIARAAAAAAAAGTSTDTALSNGGASTSAAGALASASPPPVEPAPSNGKSSWKGKGKALTDSSSTAPPGHPRADLCVVALRAYKAGEIVMCKGGVKDLTKDEDVALREEAAGSRDARDAKGYAGVLGPGRDFSIIRSARKGCSQLLLGPARFVNHDCNPNTEFHRIGSSQMAFKTLRPIGLNEEITTYYGDNYFEWGNSECLCATCEYRGRGAYAPRDGEPGALPLSVEAAAESPADSNGGDAAANARRTSGRKTTSSRQMSSTYSPGVPSLSPTPALSVTPHEGVSSGTGSEASSIVSTRSGRSITHHISDREASEYLHVTMPRGDRLTCNTCGAKYWALESWWTPDECRRCERHFRIYKADWPSRKPTERPYTGLAELKMYRGQPSMKGRHKRGAVDQDVDQDAASATPVAPSKRKARISGEKGPARKLGAPKAEDAASDASATPVKLTPLRDAPPDQPGGSTVKAEGSPVDATPTASKAAAVLPPPPKAEPEHKEQPLKRRKSKVLLAPPDPIMPESGDPDEDAIDLALGTSAPHVSSHTAQAPATSSVQATKQSGRDVLPDFESLSDLSDPSESEVVKQRGKGHRKKVEYSSSDGGDVPAAPKMLGPQARTETLALFWGAVDGGRRARRPSSNAPERPVVTPRMSRSSGQGHRRSGSGASSRASASRAAIADDEEMDVDDDELRSAMRRPLKKKKKLAPSSSDEEAAAAMPAVSDSRRSSLTHKPTQSAAEAGPQNGHAPARRASLAAPEASVSSGQTSGASSPASAVALATQGSERTSVKNLALFWSAGLNEEGGRTRRQAHRDPKTVTQVPERAKRARASGEAARSSDDSRSATPELKRSKRGAGLKARVSESDVPSISSWHGSREGQMDVSPPSSDTPLRSSSSSQVDKTPSASTSFGWPAGSPAPPPLTAPSPSARVAPGLARPLSASPLAGPFPPASAQPGQPIRRNLRWGSGKVSTSRPLSASPAQGQQPRSSPLVGPAAASQMGVPRPDLKLARLTSTSADAVPQSQSSGAARLPSAVPFATGARRASPGGPSARPSSPLAKLATGLGEFKVPASPASPRCGPASASAKEAAQSGAAPPAAPGAEQLGPALELDAPPTPAALRVPFLAEAPASAAEASQPVKMELDEPALKDTAAAAAPPLATAPLAAPEQRPASETTL